MPVPVLSSFQTIKKIKNSPSLRFIIENSLLINGIQFILPVVTYRFAQFFIHLVLNAEHEKSKQLAQDLNDFVQVMVYILSLRLILKNLMFNLVATSGATMIFDTEFYDLNQVDGLCNDCPEKVDNKINLVVHYGLTTFAIAMLQLVINTVPYIGSPTSFTMGAYWKGWLAFQYPLARHNICPEHQVSLLYQNKMKIVLFGLLFQSIESIINAAVSKTTNETLIKYTIITGLSQFVTLISLMHAQQIGIKIPNSLSKLPQNHSMRYADPVNVLWTLSALTSKQLKALIRSTFSKKAKTNLLVEQIKHFYSRSQNQLALQNTLYILRFLLLAHELQSLKTFAAAPAIRPYMLRFLKELSENLKNPSDIQQNAFVQLVLKAFNTSYVSGPLKLLTTYTLQFVNPNISYEITQASIQLIHLLNQHLDLKKIHKTIVEAEQHCQSSCSANKQGFFRSFGKKPPTLFFAQDPFYAIDPESEEAKHAKNVRRNFASASSLDDSNQDTPVTLRRSFSSAVSLDNSNQDSPVTANNPHRHFKPDSPKNNFVKIHCPPNI